ncbi:uncharacterized protein LOC142233947 isoform X3 [Haematobia irritans]|uniref:uncharacterized protein LOC142222283 isoform X3 n=1 Tax=Haematobia irritans TaxID=7368 RepID=UPI003F4FBA4D
MGFGVCLFPYKHGNSNSKGLQQQHRWKNLIQRVGGSDMPSFMRAAIKSVISDKLAVNLTWRGTPTKPSIQNFVSFKIIKDICNLKYTHCTITDINRVYQQHVLHARDRLISRKTKN